MTDRAPDAQYEIDLWFLQRIACLSDLERRYLQSDRTVWTTHINAVRATITPDEWSLIRQLSDDVRQMIPGAHTITPPDERRPNHPALS